MNDPANEPVTIPDAWSERATALSPLTRIAAAARRVLVDAGLLTRSNGLTRRAWALICVALVTVLVFLHLKAQSAEVKRNTDVLAQLATMKLIDARWDVAVLQSRGPNAPSGNAVQGRDVLLIQRALEGAAGLARSNALRAAVVDLKKAYAEKSDLVTRYQRASSDSRQALEAAMRADSAVSGLVRSAWRDFPQRDRLVAAENLVARVLAEAQQYHHAPSAAHREVLELAAADLPRAHTLPAPVLAGLARLESDVHQLLLLKPLEQMLGDRLTVLNTAARADEVAETFRRNLADALVERTRYVAALLIYSAALLLAGVYAGLGVYRRYRALEARVAEQAAELAEARARVRGGETTQALESEMVYVETDAGIEPAKVRFIHRN